MVKIAKFQMDDGRIARFEVPDDYTPEQAQSEIQFYISGQKQQDQGGFFPSANRAIAGAFGAPVDLVSSGMKAIGVLPEDTVPVGGSESIRNAMQRMGIGVATGEETDIASRAGRIAGDAASFLIPAGAAANAVAQGSSRLAQPAQRLLEGIARNPKSFAAMEAAGVGGAALGGEIAAQATEGQSPTAEMVGEIAGGLVSPFAVTGGLLGRAGIRAVKGGIAPFTESGARVRAGNRVQGAVVDPVQAQARLAEETISDLTPAQRIGDDRLLEIERAVAARNPQNQAALAERDAANLAILRNEAQQGGDIGAARDYLTGRRDSLIAGIQQDAEQALLRAQETASGLSPNMRTTDASRVVREELENAFSRAKARERELWNAVPAASMNPTASRRAFREVMADLPAAQADDVPEVARRLLGTGGMRGVQSIKEMQGLRSKLMEESRIARSAGQYNKARVSDILADAVLEDLGARAGAETGPVGVALREALDYSRGVRETYGQGNIARILGSDRVGGDRVASELTLQTVLGSGRDRGAAGLGQLLGAADSPQTREAVGEFIRENLQNMAIRDGRLNTVAAEKFVRQNAEILDQFPDIRKQITEAIAAERSSIRAAGRERDIGSNIIRSQKSATAQFLNAPVGEEINTILRSKDPKKSARDIMGLVRRDADAVAGVRSGAIEHLIRRAETDGLDEFGRAAISGDKLMRQLKDTRTRDAMKEILGTGGVQRLERVAQELSKIERAQKSGAASRIMDDTPNYIISSVVGTMAARAGAKLGAGTSGASLRTSAMMSQQANRLMGGLTNDKAEELLIMAVQDKELMEALLKNVNRPSQAKEASRMINAWAASPIGRAFFEEDEE